MKRITISSLLLVVLSISFMFGQTAVESIKSAKKFEKLGQQALALKKYQSALKADASNIEALTGASSMCATLGANQASSSKRDEYYTKAVYYAKEALNASPDGASSNFAMAVAIGRQSEVAGSKKRLALSKEIKAYALKAIKADPNHVGANYVMGRWHMKLSNLSAIERTVANTVLGGVPPEASNEKAIQYLEMAAKLNAKRVLYQFSLAEAYNYGGQTDKAIAQLNKALALRPVAADGAGIHKKCQELLDDLK